MLRVYTITSTIGGNFEWAIPKPLVVVFLLLLFCLLIAIGWSKKWRSFGSEVKVTLEIQALRLFLWFFISGVIWAILFTLFPPILLSDITIQENSLYRLIANLFVGVTCWWLFLLIGLLILPRIVFSFPILLLNIVQINVVFLDVLVFCLEPLIALMTSVRLGQILQKMSQSDIQRFKRRVKDIRMVSFVFVILVLFGWFVLPYLLKNEYIVNRRISITREASNSQASFVLKHIENSSIVDFIGNDSLKARDNLTNYMNNDTLNYFLSHANDQKQGSVTLEWRVSVVQTNNSLSTINISTFSFLYTTIQKSFVDFYYLGWWQNGSLYSLGSVEPAKPFYVGKLNETPFYYFSAPFYWIFRGKFQYSLRYGPLSGYEGRVTQLFLFTQDLDPVCFAYSHDSLVY